jgi:hypothetical protein
VLLFNEQRLNSMLMTSPLKEFYKPLLKAPENLLISTIECVLTFHNFLF